MLAMRTDTPQPIRLTDYRPPAFLVDEVHLTFDLKPNATRVKARLAVRRNGDHAEPLKFNGERLKPISVAIDGRVLVMPKDIAEARQHLMALRGKTHELLTAVAVTRGTEILWRYLDVPRLTMRDFSDAFLDDYLKRVGENVLRSVGAYQLEGLGAQLFDRVEGDHFSVLGLPLLPLLAFLREQGIALQ